MCSLNILCLYSSEMQGMVVKTSSVMGPDETAGQEWAVSSVWGLSKDSVSPVGRNAFLYSPLCLSKTKAITGIHL